MCQRRATLTPGFTRMLPVDIREITQVTACFGPHKPSRCRAEVYSTASRSMTSAVGRTA